MCTCLQTHSTTDLKLTKSMPKPLKTLAMGCLRNTYVRAWGIINLYSVDTIGVTHTYVTKRDGCQLVLWIQLSIITAKGVSGL